MSLAEKMFARGSKTCPLRTDCRQKADRKFVDSLFEDAWEVFVIRPNANGELTWFTLCCEGSEQTEPKEPGRLPVSSGIN